MIPFVPYEPKEGFDDEGPQNRFSFLIGWPMRSKFNRMKGSFENTTDT